MKQRFIDVKTSTSAGTVIDVLSVNKCSAQQLNSILTLVPSGTVVTIEISEVDIDEPQFK